eukprot:5660524-Alexandrium_andersonii.AAC.1
MASMTVSVTHSVADRRMSILDRGSIDWLEARVLRYLDDAGVWVRVHRQCDLACQQHGSVLRSELVGMVDGCHRSDAEEI